MTSPCKYVVLFLAASASMGFQTAPQAGRPATRPGGAAGGAATRRDGAGINMPTTTRTTRPRGRAWNDESTKYAPTVYRTLAPVAAKASASVATISMLNYTLYATVVRADGYLVTKASELKTPTFDVRLPSGVNLKGKIVSVNVDNDLALIQVPTTNLTPVEWANPEDIQLGEIVIAPSEKKEPMGWGVLSVLKRPSTGGMMGVMLAETADGVKVNTVNPNMPADKAGIRSGDIIVKVNDTAYKTLSELQDFLQTQSAGTEISVTVKRGEQDLVFRLSLASRNTLPASERSVSQNTLAGALSERATDFPSVLEHDIVLQPHQQGGPLLNLDGKAIGINIARAGRVETYATPAEVVQKLLPDLIAKKYPPTTHPVQMASTGGRPNVDGEAVDPSEDKRKADEMSLESLRRLVREAELRVARDTDNLDRLRKRLADLTGGGGGGSATRPSTRP